MPSKKRASNCVRFEKTETPARFEPMPSKKRADRMLHVSFGTHKKKQSFGSETPERQQQSSLCQASASDSKRPKHQQDSSPCQAKNAQATASDSKRPKHQQDSSPCQAKNAQTECFTSPLEPIKNKASAPKQANASMSRASAKQKTIRNVDSERWLLKVSSASDSSAEKWHRLIEIFCNNFLGALPLTATRGRRIECLKSSGEKPNLFHCMICRLASWRRCWTWSVQNS